MSSHQYKRDLGGAVFGYLAKLDRLRILDRTAFDAQVVSWLSEPRIFGRLRIWHALNPARSSPEQAFASIDALSDEAFWMVDHQRDLLHVLRDRWAGFTPEWRQRLERRLLEGAIRPWPTESDERFRARRAHTVLDALHWLQGQGVEFSFDWQNEEVTRLRADAPRWTDTRPSSAVEPMVSRGGAVRTDADHTALDDLPVEEVVERAAAIAGPTNDFLVEADPFLGLVRDNPDRALAAIERATASRDEVTRALSALLWEDVVNRRAGLTTPIAELLTRVGDAVFTGAIGAVARWLDKVTATRGRLPSVRPIATPSWIAASRSYTDAERDPIETPPRRTDWVFKAINAPAGNLAEALMRDEVLPNSADGAGLPEAWCGRAERLLDLPEPHRDLALVILASNLPYLFAQDRGWARRRLIPAFADDRRAAALAGLLQVHTGLTADLFAEVKAVLVDEVTSAVESSETADEQLFEWVGGQLLAAWVWASAPLSDEEMTVTLAQGSDPFRAAVLEHCERWLREGAGSDIRTRLLEFFRSVWPKQAIARSGATTQALAAVAFAAGDDLPAFRQAVEPFLLRGDQWPELYQFHDLAEVARRAPEDVLDLLDRIAPDETTSRPYDLDETLDAVIQAAPGLGQDPRMVRLRGEALQ